MGTKTKSQLIDEKGVVTLFSDINNLDKNGKWVLFGKILKIGTEINIKKPDEYTDKIRVYKVLKVRGFKHYITPIDKRNKVGGLKKGMQFLFIKFKKIR